MPENLLNQNLLNQQTSIADILTKIVDQETNQNILINLLKNLQEVTRTLISILVENEESKQKSDQSEVFLDYCGHWIWFLPTYISNICTVLQDSYCIEKEQIESIKKHRKTIEKTIAIQDTFPIMQVNQELFINIQKKLNIIFDTYIQPQ